MLQTAKDMRQASERDVYWVDCSYRVFGQQFVPWLAKQVFKDKKQIQTAVELIDALPKDRPATIFLHHSELLFIDVKCFPYVFVEHLAYAIKISNRNDINIIFANSRPEIAKAVLKFNSIKLLGPPDCCRWQEYHVRAFVQQRLGLDPKWTDEDKEVLIKLGTAAGSVGFIETWMLAADPKNLSSKLPYAEELGERWNALKAIYPPPL